MNARIQNDSAIVLNDFFGSDGGITNLMSDNESSYNNVISVLKAHNCLTRASRDTGKPNNYGYELINLCKMAKLIILNGRSGVDKEGNFTSIQPNGNSITDYVLCTAGIFGSIKQFKVNNKFPESDHVPITFSIKCNTTTSNEINTRGIKWDNVYKYVWDYESLNSLKQTLLDRQLNPLYRNFKTSISNLECSSIVSKKYSEYIKVVLDTCFY